VLILLAGFIARIVPANRLFLDPDEALHNLLASQATVGRAWAAALTNAHPPLLILVLYFWRGLGQSELWLRLPSILAGTAACWLFYQWLRLATDRATALIGLLMFSFAPSLILLSAQVRQYALLLFFMTGCLYLSERAVRKNSAGAMILFSLSLYGALLTHYSALIFAFAMCVYLLVRLYPYRERVALVTVWSAGQVGGLGIAIYLLFTHILPLRRTGMVSADLDTYLRKATFHPGERNVVEFIAAQTLRAFTYVFSHGLVGTIALMAFLNGLFWLLKRDSSPNSDEHAEGPTSRELALLLGVPFVVTWGVALAGVYPLGATRHDAFLAPFVIGGASIGIAAWIPVRNPIKYAGLVLCLAVCNLFPAPPPPMRAKDQLNARMADAVAYLRASVPRGSAVLTDYESGLLLGYYFCGHGVVQVFPPLEPMATANCGDYTVLSTSFRDWKLTADTFPGELDRAKRMMGPGTEIWLFYSGWINDSSLAMKKELAGFGCVPQNFGENILVCRLAAE
jgi:hypothetical protein